VLGRFRSAVLRLVASPDPAPRVCGRACVQQPAPKKPQGSIPLAQMGLEPIRVLVHPSRAEAVLNACPG
jgi:hypothetical protein